MIMTFSKEHDAGLNFYFTSMHTVCFVLQLLHILTLTKYGLY